MLTWVEWFSLAPFIGYELWENPGCISKMGITTWRKIVEHDETLKLFFSSINGFSSAFRMVSCCLWVSFCWLMLMGVCLTFTLLFIFIVSVRESSVRESSVVSALKLAFRSIEKLLLIWWLIGPILCLVIIKDVSCVSQFYFLSTKSMLCSFIILQRRSIIKICNKLELE